MFKIKTMDKLTNDVAISLQHHSLIRSAKARVIASNLSTKDLLLFKKFLPTYKDYALRKIKIYHELTAVYNLDRVVAGEIEVIRNILASTSDNVYTEKFPTVSLTFTEFVLTDFYPQFLLMADVVRVLECGPDAAFYILSNMPEQARDELAASLSYIHNEKYLLSDDKQIETNLYLILQERIEKIDASYRIYQRGILNATRVFYRLPNRVKNIILLTPREEAILTLLKKQWQVDPITALKYLESTEVDTDIIIDYFQLIKKECIKMVMAGIEINSIHKQLLELDSPVRPLTKEFHQTIFNIDYISKLRQADNALMNILLMPPQKRKALLFNTDIAPTKIYDICVSIRNFGLRIIQNYNKNREQIRDALKLWKPELSVNLPTIPPLSLNCNIRRETIYEQFITDAFVDILMKLPDIYAYDIPVSNPERLMAENRNADEVYRALITDSDTPTLSFNNVNFLRSPTPLITGPEDGPAYSSRNIFYLSTAFFFIFLLFLFHKLISASYKKTSSIVKEIGCLPKPKSYISFLTEDEIDAFKSYLSGLTDSKEKAVLQRDLQRYLDYTAGTDALSQDLVPDIEDPITIDALFSAIEAVEDSENADKKPLLNKAERRWIKTYAYDYMITYIEEYKADEYFLEPETRDRIFRDENSSLEIYRNFSRASIEFVQTVREILAQKNMLIEIKINPPGSFNIVEMTPEDEISSLSPAVTYPENFPRLRM